jgi:muramoyltetrapeptide carboxypeptidase
MLKVQGLKRGDVIGVVAPSKKVSSEQKELANNFSSYMKEIGLKVVFSSDFGRFDEFSVSSSSPKERAKNINSMFSDSSIAAIWLFQGGETCNELLPYLDYELISKKPKIIVGKSDCDVLLMAISKKCNFYTFHGCDAKYGNKKELDYEYTRQFFEERLMKGEKDIVPYFPWKFMRENESMKFSGEIIGCNSHSILKLLGTSFFPDFDKKVFFLEDSKPSVSGLISRITQLKQIGVFDKINALVIGHIFEFDGQDLESHINYEDVVFNLLKEYDFPILKIDEFGHYFPHAFLPLGSKVEFDISKGMKLTIVDDFLEISK